MTTLSISLKDLKLSDLQTTLTITLLADYSTEANDIVVGSSVTVNTNATGDATVSLAKGGYRLEVLDRTFLFSVTGSGTANLIDIIGIQTETPIQRGLPTGGTTNQVLAKASNTNYDVAWVNQTGGGGSTNLSYTASPTQGIIVSDTGTDATIPATDGTNAGLFLPSEKSKLAGIEAGAEVNNISDANATDLTDGGDTTLHTHDSRYYTETETNTLLNNKIDLNGNNSAITYANFTPSVSPTHQEGRVWYDSGNRTLSVYDNFSGTSIQLGKELIVDARNNSGVQINNGQVVYISGALGQNPTIALARADSSSTSQIIGVATHDIANNTSGKITVLGLVNDIDTSAFADGSQVYLSASTAGGLTATPPASPNFVTFVGYIAHSHATQGKLLVICDRAMSNNNNLGTSQTIFPTQNAVKTYVDTGLATKQNTLTIGNLTESTSSVLTITGGTGAIIGSGTTIQVRQATTSQSGFLSNTDWNTFNNKQNNLGFTPENVANKENITLDTSTTKYPTNNLVKTNIDLKANIASPTFTGVVVVPQIRTTKQTLTPTGTTQTIDWNNGSIIDLSLASATGNVTLTLSNPQSATTYLIEVTQGATPRNLIFPAGTLQAGGGSNTYTGVANQRDVIAVLWDGTQYLISVSKNYS